MIRLKLNFKRACKHAGLTEMEFFKVRLTVKDCTMKTLYSPRKCTGRVLWHAAFYTVLHSNQSTLWMVFWWFSSSNIGHRWIPRSDIIRKIFNPICPTRSKQMVWYFPRPESLLQQITIKKIKICSANHFCTIIFRIGGTAPSLVSSELSVSTGQDVPPVYFITTSSLSAKFSSTRGSIFIIFI